jgi:hypothetical protein
VIRGGIGLFYENSVWNNILYDRPARLRQGLFLANPTVCSNGQANTSFTMPDGSIPTIGFCGETIGQAAGAIAAFQAQYQAATLAAGPANNPSYIGTLLSDGFDATGTTLLDPKYVSPRSVQMNIGIQQEFRKGMVFTLDYLRNIETHTLLAVDTNHVGDSRYFNLANAQAAVSTTTGQFGCAGGYSASAIDCAIVAGAKIADFASNGLDSGYSLCGGGPCVAPLLAAFPGINQNLGANQMLSPSGRATYSGLQLSLKQDLRNPFKHSQAMNLQVSYAYSKYTALASDSDFVNIATDFNNPLHYIGPSGLDRRHQVSFGGTIDLPYSFRVGAIGHFYSPLPVTLTLAPSGNAGGIFVTDITGDGTGDGSFAANGGGGDVLPGTNIGSFGRGVKAGDINAKIQNYNQNFAGRPTPAGQALISNAMFTQGQLQALGGVQQVIPLAPQNQADMAWLRAFDLSLNWIYKVKERAEIQPGVSFFNVMNLSNFDGPNNPLSGALTGTPGSVNGTAGVQPNSNRLGLGSGVFALGSPRVIEFSLKVSF